eukprot:GHRR01023170.1.p1 GENE.GHRR01023170.1~~GHRR01023170.1.p1  ORF type:complete len:229 (+),score=50.13 GHRR01023170.1:213-899(+)
MPLREVQNLASTNLTHTSAGCKAAPSENQMTAMAPHATTNLQEALPVFDLAPFLALDGQAPSAELLQLCQQLADCLARTGCLVVRDPHVAAADNDTFLDLLETYFSRSDEEKQAEARPELSYQVGVTPAGVEVPRCLCEAESSSSVQQQHLEPDQQPTLPTGADVKWRYMWRVGLRPQHTQYAELNAEPVVPQVRTLQFSTQQANTARPLWPSGCWCGELCGIPAIIQ